MKYKCCMCNKMIEKAKGQWKSDFLKHYNFRRCVPCDIKLQEELRK